MKNFVVALALTAAPTLAACEPQPAPPQAPTFSSKGLRAMKAADGAEGSGCLADSGRLPDGAWFGFVKAWDTAGIDLDPACFYWRAPAAREAAARNQESPPPNDFFIANDSKNVRRILVAPDAAAVRVTHTKDGGVTMNDVTTYRGLLADSGTYIDCPGEFCGVWVFVNGGIATEVTMQYLP